MEVLWRDGDSIVNEHFETGEQAGKRTEELLRSGRGVIWGKWSESLGEQMKWIEGTGFVLKHQ